MRSQEHELYFNNTSSVIGIIMLSSQKLANVPFLESVHLIKQIDKIQTSSPIIPLLSDLIAIENNKTDSIANCLESVLELMKVTAINNDISICTLVSELMKTTLMSDTNDIYHINGLELMSKCDKCMTEISTNYSLQKLDNE